MARVGLEHSVIMDTFLGWSQTAWTGLTALLTAGLLVIAAVAALYAFWQVKIARGLAEESRKAGLEASRPYVIVTAEPSRASQQLFDLVVRNIGQRPALAVSIALDPPPIRANEIEGHELAKAKLLNQPVAMIAPAQEMRAHYDSHIERHGREDVPSSHKVSLRYQDSSGHKYEEVSVVDLEAMKGAVYTGVKTLHDVGKTLAEIQKTLKGASILARRGSVEVEASIEPRSEQQDRRAREAADSRERHDQLVARLQPAATAAGHPEEAQRPGTSGHSVLNLVKRAAAWAGHRT